MKQKNNKTSKKLANGNYHNTNNVDGNSGSNSNRRHLHTYSHHDGQK